MERATHICTHCGYEGKPVKPPSDAYHGQSDTSQAIGRVANLILPGVGFLIRPLAMFVSLPLYVGWWIIKPEVSPKKHCPQCGLPLMVKLSSDAGYVAKRKMEVKEGAVFRDDAPKPKTAFGREVTLPGDEIKAPPAPPKTPEKLPSLQEMLQEAPKQVAVAEEVPAAASEQKKPVDPDQW